MKFKRNAAFTSYSGACPAPSDRVRVAAASCRDNLNNRDQRAGSDPADRLILTAKPDLRTSNVSRNSYGRTGISCIFDVIRLQQVLPDHGKLKTTIKSPSQAHVAGGIGARVFGRECGHISVDQVDLKPERNIK